MATINWTVTIGATSFSTITQSLSFTMGRPSWFDSWSGNSCTLTVRNNTGQAANIAQGDLITIGNNLSALSLYFYVVEVTFQDEIAANGNTATITGRDPLGQILQFPISGEPGTYTNSLEQVSALMDSLAPFNPPYPDPSPPSGRAIVETSFSLTTIGQRIADLILTENSRYYFDGQTMIYPPSKAPTAGQFNFGTDSSTSIVYDRIQRKYPNANYPNQVNVTSTTVGTTTSTVTGTYRRNYNRNVLLTGSAQQQAQTDYYANTLSDKTALYMDVSFNDSAQATAQLTKVVDDLPLNGGQTTTVTYTAPGGGATTLTMVIEGATISAIPGQTNFTYYLSPRVIYDLFTLDSSTFGILGGTMLYDTPITYNDAGETYDATATDNGNRLGW